MRTNRKIIVQKFGGTSVGDVNKIKRVADRVAKSHEAGKSVVVVVSALGDSTDELLALASSISKDPPERELDMLLSTGEQISIALLAMALHEKGLEAVSFTGAQVGIMTDSSHTQARIIDINTDRIKKHLKKRQVAIVAGFQGISADQEITTLGRGGSDMTAVALAKVLKAEVCEIYTDVKGVYTADPRVVRNARKLPELSYEEMLELASLGAQVIQARSMEVASKFNVPVHVRSSMHKENGTLITKEVKAMEDVLVRGVTVNKKEAKVTVCDVPDKPGEASRLFEGLAKNNINVDMIVQNISRVKKSTDISFTVEKRQLSKTKKMIERIAKGIGAKGVNFDDNIAKVSVVGIGMRSHSGVAAKMFQALARKKINISMISTSEIKISCVVSKGKAEDAVKAVHREFSLHKVGSMNSEKKNKKGMKK